MTGIMATAPPAYEKISFVSALGLAGLIDSERFYQTLYAEPIVFASHYLKFETQP